MKLNQQQQSAVDAESPLVVVTASPGSGKTATLVEKIKHDVRFVPPKEMGVFTFTVAAAREFEQRIAKAGVPKLGFVGTLHGWALRYGIQCGTIATAIDGVAYKRMIDAELKRLAFSDGLASKVKSALIEGKDLRGKGKIGIQSVRKSLAKRKICPVNNLISEATKLLKENGKEHKPFTAIYVDEYQDTSNSDHACYNAMEADRRFYVGDSDQSIYTFRGSNHRNLDALAEEASKQGGHFLLEYNYRSGKRICDFAQNVISGVENRVPKKTIAATQANSTVSVQTYETDAGECIAMATAIKNELQAGTAPNEIAILTRYNADATRIAEALRKGHDIKVALLGELTEAEREKIDLAIELVADPLPEHIKKWEQIYGTSPSGYDPLVIADGNLETALRVSGISAILAQEIARAAFAGGGEWSRQAESVQRLREAANEIVEESREEDHIHIMTMHASKGKEFQFVWIAHADSKALPDTDEARRLAFVAATRAKRDLVVSSCQIKPDFVGKFERGLTGTAVFQ